MTRYCDAHIHLSHSKKPEFSVGEQYFCVSSCHSQEEFEFLSGASLTRALPLSCAFPFGSGVPPLGSPRSSASLPTGSATATYPCAFISYGIHPQSPSLKETSFVKRELEYLESLLASKKIVAVGECGFDFFTQEFKATAREQENVFEAQLALAQKYNVPLVLHLRKAIEKIFSYSRALKDVRAVIFHSFPGTLREAKSLRNHGINAFFSFGKPVLNGKKSAIDCLSNLPSENLLLETDAPYQTLKGEQETFPSEIKRVYEMACQLRKCPAGELSSIIYENFCRAFGI